MSEKHCPTCVCSKRAPAQADHFRTPNGRGPGTIAFELTLYLGHDPTTWASAAASERSR